MSLFIDDTALYLAFQQGDPVAERAVFTRFFKPVCIFAEQITGDTLHTEDLFTEGFQKSWDRRYTLETFGDFRRFLYFIVRNAALTYVKTRKIHQRIEKTIGDVQSSDIEPGDSALDREILRAELLQAIYQEIEELPGRCREIVKHIFIDNLSTEEIAAKMGLNVQTVRSQKHRAMDLIRTRLLKKGRTITLILLYQLLQEAGDPEKILHHALDAVTSRSF